MVRQTDAAGNTSPASPVLDFTLDTTAPTAPTLVLAEDTGASNSDGITSNGTVNVSGLEANATWEYSTHGGSSWTVGTGSNVTLSGDGAKSVVVRQTDVAGNTSPASPALNFTLDTTASAPTLALAEDTGASNSITSNGTVNVTGLEANATWEYSTHGGSSWTVGTGSSVTLSGDGAKSIVVRQTDVAGNTSLAGPALNFTLDTTAPTAPTLVLAEDTGASNSITSNGTVNVTGLEANATWEYSTHGGSSWTVGTGSSVTLSGDGAKSIVVRQTDAAGNTSPASPVLDFTLDTTAPTAPTLVLAEDTGASNSDGMTSNGTVNVSGLEANATWEYSTHGGSTWTDGTGSSITLSGDGAKSIVVRQTDAAGNTSPVGPALNFTLDTTAPPAPTLVLAEDTSNSDGSTSNGTVNVNGLEEGASWEYSTHGGSTWTDGTGSSVTLSGDGAKSIVVRQTDAAGNTSLASQVLNFTLNTPENTFDGVTIDRQQQSDGTQVITVPVVTDRHQDDSTTPNQTHVDIPVATNTQGETALTASVPTGVGLTVEGSAEPISNEDALAELIRRIQQKTVNDSDAQAKLSDEGRAFLASLSPEEPLIIKTITPIIPGDTPPGEPIIITGSNNSDGSKTALVIDASQLPKGTVLQIDNVDFVTIVGAVRVIGGQGQNIAVGDNDNQFIVLGEDDDIIRGGGGEDTVGSLGGSDQVFGDEGDDIVYGGADHDILSGGPGSDRLNGGFGFDIALQPDALSDYRIDMQSATVILTHLRNGEVDTLIDVERVQFDQGSSLAIAHSQREAVAHHLITTWLGRDMTQEEGAIVQSMETISTAELTELFRTVLAPESIQLLSHDELLAGLDDNPHILRLTVQRYWVGDSEYNQGYVELGLGLMLDGGTGFDVLRMTGSRADVHLIGKDGRLELTRYEDGAMLSIVNGEMVAFDSGEVVVLANNLVEGILARLVQTFLDRNATIEEWQIARALVKDEANYQSIFDWFQDQANLQGLSDQDYIQTLYQNTLGRQANEEELNGYLTSMQNGEFNRDWLAVDLASSEEAITVIGSVMQFEILS